MFLIIYKDGDNHHIAVEGLEARLQRRPFALEQLVVGGKRGGDGGHKCRGLRSLGYWGLKGVWG